jgi:predicted DCC family thiol-disulfide oxidoreductase YuxK
MDDSASPAHAGLPAFAGRRQPYSYRHDGTVPAFPDDRPIIVFDGMCVLCSGWVRFVLRHDRKGLYRFIPAQSALGRALYVHYGLDPEDYETNILIQDGRAWFKAGGTIRMLQNLGLPWSLAGALRIVPAAWLDPLYERLARNRFRLGGRLEACYRPDPRHEGRFLA